MKKLSDREVLKKCIEIAIEDGWNPDKSFGKIDRVEIWDDCCCVCLEYEGGEGYYFHGEEGMDIIFRHDFAKHLFGEHQVSVVFGKPQSVDVWDANGEWTGTMLAYDYHLQLLASAEDRMVYLNKFLERKNEFQTKKAKDKKRKVSS